VLIPCHNYQTPSITNGNMTAGVTDFVLLCKLSTIEMINKTVVTCAEFVNGLEVNLAGGGILF
jgi:hypothetical protein